MSKVCKRAGKKERNENKQYHLATVITPAVVHRLEKRQMIHVGVEKPLDATAYVCVDQLLEARIQLRSHLTRAKILDSLIQFLQRRAHWL